MSVPVNPRPSPRRARPGLVLAPALVFALVLAPGCLGAVSNARSYYVLAGDPATPPERPTIDGSVRVRNMDVDAVYEKFQIVVRKNPYELRYSDLHVWAVKPNQMVSDIIARTLVDTGAFADVSRALGDTRPDFTLSGDLNALEIYDSDDVWFAHLSLSLRLNRFDDGEQVWSMSYDQRKPVESRNHAQAVRAISELLSACVRRAVIELEDKALEVGGERRALTSDERRREEERERRRARALERATPSVEPAPSPAPDAPVYVPESPR